MKAPLESARETGQVLPLEPCFMQSRTLKGAGHVAYVSLVPLRIE